MSSEKLIFWNTYNFCLFILGDVTEGKKLCNGTRTKKNRKTWRKISARQSFGCKGFPPPGWGHCLDLWSWNINLSFKCPNLPFPTTQTHTSIHLTSPIVSLLFLHWNTLLQCIFKFSVKKQRIRPAKNPIANAIYPGILHRGTPHSEIC